jgi:hypothetical protein
LFAASRHWGVSLHFNQGLAGASAAALQASRDTAMNPAAFDAFALLISGAEGPPAYPGISGREPDVATARREDNPFGARSPREHRAIADGLPVHRLHYRVRTAPGAS